MRDDETDGNQVWITGRLVRDPQLRITVTGDLVCVLRVACNKMFFNVRAWNDDAQEAVKLAEGDE